MSVADTQLERLALARLSRIRGPASLHAAILALITPPHSVPSFVAWTSETQACPTAPILRQDVAQLSDASRLPCLEALLQRMRGCPADDRRTLLESTRRVVAAISPLRPLDRLHWLLMRRRLGEAPLPVVSTPCSDLRSLPAATLAHLGSVAAYLARMVTGPTPADTQRWYAAAMAPLAAAGTTPPFRTPDGDGLARSLNAVEALPRTLRPLLLKAWVQAACTVTHSTRLSPLAADALRLLAGLLEAPLPPELAQYYSELDWNDAAA